MKKLNLVLSIFIGITIFSCSSDDNSNTNDTQSGFNYNGVFYPTSNLYLNYINDEPSDTSISLIMVSENLIDNCENNDVDYVLLQFSTTSADVILEEMTYTDLDYDFFDYVVFNNGVFNSDCDLIDSEMIFNDSTDSLMADSISLTINSINDNNIDLNYSMTREDGSIINGNYIGSYTDVSDF